MKKNVIMIALTTMLPMAIYAGGVDVEQFHYQKKVDHHSYNTQRGPHHISFQRQSYGRYSRPYYVAPRFGYRDRYYPYRNSHVCGTPKRVIYARPTFRVGEIIRQIPYGAQEVIVDGVHCYRYGRHYFLPKRRGSLRVYLVMAL